jgi:ATP-dependent DNA helicase RecQ
VPVLALTATATSKVVSDIEEQLSMHEPRIFRGSFYRPNLRLSAYQKGDSLGMTAKEAVLRIAQARVGQSGIIYCLSRKKTEEFAEYLAKNGLRAKAYHAGLSAEERDRVQDAFQNDDVDIVAATIAFGMGIDKSNVRYVIHGDMPRSIEGYYQEIGRAGRDGLESECILLYSWSEVIAYDRFSEEIEDTAAKERARNQVREMYDLAEAKSCRHQTLVYYFHEEMGECGESCDRCSARDVLRESRPVFSKRPKAPVAPRVARESRESLEVDSDLFDKLRALRKEIADERDVPAYVVFSDATLLEMAAKKPRTLGELAFISGVGPTKLARYGEVFLKALREN